MIWQRRWNDPPTFLDRLRDEILRQAAEIPSSGSKNVGGWRSREDVLDWPLDEVQLLLAHMREAAVAAHATTCSSSYRRAFKFRAWAIVNRRGSFHRRHLHSESVWSGIYYVDAGGEPSARTFIETAPEPVYVTPEPGLMVVFPSLTWHSVEPHRGDGNRITIAFDAQ